MRIGMRVSGLAVTLALLGFAPSAFAATRYLSQQTGADASNDCTLQASPCRTLAHLMGQATGGDKLIVAAGTYTASITLADGQSLIHQNFDGTSGPAILDNGNAGTADITVAAPQGAGLIKGFTIRSQTLPMALDSYANVTGDTFDESAPIAAEIHMGNDDTSPNARITHDTFIDPTPLMGSSDRQIGIDDLTLGGPVIAHDRFESLWEGVEVSGPNGRVTVKDNLFTGIHGVSGFTGSAILVFPPAIKATIARNRIVNPDLTFPAGGISMLVNGRISQNLVDGYYEGIVVDDTSKPVTLDSNATLTATSDQVGLLVSDSTVDAAREAHIDNLTAWGPGHDVEITKANVTVDSSLIGGKGIETYYGSNHCSIAHSRGPKSAPGDHGCSHFVTTAGPKLKADSVHLKASSPLIDLGNPHKPPKGSEDIDSQKRALPGNCGAKHVKARRDIGADEFKCPKGHHH